MVSVAAIKLHVPSPTLNLHERWLSLRLEGSVALLTTATFDCVRSIVLLGLGKGWWQRDEMLTQPGRGE